MEKLGHPGLIVYTTEAETRGEVRSLLRPRPLIYGGLITALAVSAVLVLRAHVTFEAELSRSPGSTFVLDDDGTIRNTYLLTIGNNDPRPGADPYTVTVEGLPGAQVIAPPIAARHQRGPHDPGGGPAAARQRGRAHDSLPVPHHRAARRAAAGRHLHDARARRRRSESTHEHD